MLDDATRIPDRSAVELSTHSLTHRGPDAIATHVAPGLGLGHSRLSFVDTGARSNQPFWDETGRFALVFNGEIYNFRELRSELETEGATFHTTSDTEVLLQLLLRRPPAAALSVLEGMFAFGLYDTQEGTLLLARDRFGMKPLFIHEGTHQFLFASEVKALKPWLTLKPDAHMAASYLLSFRGPTSGHIFFDDIIAVTPGQMVYKRAGQPARFETFARLDDFLTAEGLEAYGRFSPAAIVDHVEQLLSESVKAHLLADVPVGAFCSGGVDSSLLMALAAREHNNLAIFHANVKGRWSEVGAASALARHLRLDMQAVDVEEQDFIDFIPRTIAHFEQPFADRPNCVPMMRVAELARDSGVKGLLSGEGSDECFLGYPWLGRKRLTDAYYAAGARLGALVRRIPAIGHILLPRQDTAGEAARDLFSRYEIAGDNARIAGAVHVLETSGATAHHRWTLEYLHHHLRVLLHRNDTMGMEGSIESRFPFLDHKVVRAAVNMPGSYKLRRDLATFDKAHPFMRDKWVVRAVADRYMPKGLSQRNKFGFWTTVFDRMHVNAEYFHNSWVGSHFGMTNTQLELMAARSRPAFLLRMLHLDMWGRMCIEGQGEDANIALLRRHVRIRAE